jgi:hypothetical protein
LDHQFPGETFHQFAPQLKHQFSEVMAPFAFEAGSQIDSKAKPTLQRLELPPLRKTMRVS